MLLNILIDTNHQMSAGYFDYLCTKYNVKVLSSRQEGRFIVAYLSDNSPTLSNLKDLIKKIKSSNPSMKIYRLIEIEENSFEPDSQ